MAHFLDDVITGLGVARGNIMDALSGMEAHLDQAGAALIAENFAGAGGHLYNVADYVYDLEYCLANHSTSFLVQTYYGFGLIRDNWPEDAAEEYVLTWKKICEAWAADGFEGRAITIAFIDRMRQLIWDEPFKVVWAAKPEQEF